MRFTALGGVRAIALGVAGQLFVLAAFGSPHGGIVSAAGAAEAVELAPVGQFEPVFIWEKSRCDERDIPDTPLRAVRLSANRIVAFATHFDNRRFVGKDLNSMERRCDVVFAGKGSPRPEDYSDRIWISSTWSDDGRTIFALGHDEYQAHRHPGMCKYSTYIQCWYNAVVPLKSIDGGRSFDKMGERPVATIPTRQNIDQGKNRGFFEPSNIIRYNGYYYALIRTGAEGAQKAGTCLFRTPDLSRPDAWRVFNGADFVPNVDPYRDSAVGAMPCEVLDNVKGIIGSINYIQKYRTFIVVSSFKADIDQSGAIYYSLSHDLFHWSESRILLKIPTLWSVICGQPHYGYPSLIDISAPDRNFENIESDPYLYLTRQHLQGCTGTMDRDLVRIKIHMSLR